MGKYDLERFICAFDDPYDGAQTYLNGDVVHLKGVSLNRQDGVFHSYQSGIIFRKGESWLCIAVTGCSIVIETVLDSKGKDYFQNVKVGDRFVTPHAEIEKARTRPIYTPLGLKLDRDGD